MVQGHVLQVNCWVAQLSCVVEFELSLVVVHAVLASTIDYSVFVGLVAYTLDCNFLGVGYIVHGVDSFLGVGAWVVYGVVGEVVGNGVGHVDVVLLMMESCNPGG